MGWQKILKWNVIIIPRIYFAISLFMYEIFIRDYVN
jgi:hypothetical protein